MAIGCTRSRAAPVWPLPAVRASSTPGPPATPSSLWRHMSVPLFETKAPLAPLQDDIAGARFAGVVADGRFILGPNVSAFEEEFAAYCGAGHAVGVANGTDAITLALRALGVGEGDDVVVPSFTFWASAEAIVNGRRPFPSSATSTRRRSASRRDRPGRADPEDPGRLAVHLFGNIAPVEAIAALGVPVLEDAAQSAGSRTRRRPPAGSLGPPATFSSSPRRTSAPSGARGRRDQRPRPRREACGSSASTAPATRSRSSRSASTRAWTSCRPRCCARAPTWTTGARAGSPPGAHYAEAGLGEPVALPEVEGASPPGTSTSSATAARRARRGAQGRAGSAEGVTTASPSTARRRWSIASAPARSCRPPRRSPPTTSPSP